jgi:3-oxoacyl-[acyl-carrier-protein] synthase III
MGTVIKTTGICMDKDIHSLIELSSRAAESCIAQAGLNRDEINLIISTGVFRDGNIIEPAMAPLIQKRLGINLQYNEKSRTFAFDILNGPCGLLSAIQTADAMLANGNKKNALIVSSDVHPSKSVVSTFPYRPIGTAMLLEWTHNPEKGFKAIEFRTSPSGYVGVKGIVDFRTDKVNAGKTLDILIEPDYPEKLRAYASKAIEGLLDQYKSRFNLDLRSIKLITTHPWKGFGPEISQAIGLNGNSGDCLYEKYGHLHSASLSVSYHDACINGRLQEGDRVAFVAASAGLSVGVGLYFA